MDEAVTPKKGLAVHTYLCTACRLVAPMAGAKCYQYEVAYDLAEYLVLCIEVRVSLFAAYSGCQFACHHHRRSKRGWRYFSRYHRRQHIAVFMQRREAETDG
jgi:hypothetical protein